MGFLYGFLTGNQLNLYQFVQTLRGHLFPWQGNIGMLHQCVAGLYPWKLTRKHHP